MSDQLPLFDTTGLEGDLRKQTGQTLAADAADDWTTRAVRAIASLARLQDTITADDVIARVGLPHDVATNRNNAVGAAFNIAAHERIIRRTNETVKSRRPTNNSRRITVWVPYGLGTP